MHPLFIDPNSEMKNTSDFQERFQSLFPAGANLIEPEQNIFSIHPATTVRRHYDRIGAGYDLLVGSEWYNRFFWNNTRHNYSDFAREATVANQGGVRNKVRGCAHRARRMLLPSRGERLANSARNFVCGFFAQWNIATFFPHPSTVRKAATSKSHTLR